MKYENLKQAKQATYKKSPVSSISIAIALEFISRGGQKSANGVASGYTPVYIIHRGFKQRTKLPK